MPLPILQSHRNPTPEDLVRLFYRTELHWTRHLGEEAALDTGTAFSNPQLPSVHEANRVLEAGLPEGVSPDEAMSEVARHFDERGTRCLRIATNPSAAPQRTVPLAEHLTSTGWRREAADIFHLAGQPPAPVTEVGGLTIIPARASYRHARALAEEAMREWGESSEMAEAALLHLDDPHWDALIALKDGTAVGGAGVLAVGDVGRVDDVYVPQGQRRQGIGRTLMSRALEICARSLFKHVVLCVRCDNDAAQGLYAQLGFRKIGQIVEYSAPAP